MRVVQLIDSLDPGGAERMAVNIANGFCRTAECSGLVATRQEGALKKSLDSNVKYLFLSRKKLIDFRALFLFIHYLKANDISIIHAHGSSYFFAVLTKIMVPRIKLFWHDHYGNRANESKANLALKICSLFFTGVFTVNYELKTWSEKHLYCKNSSFIPNFTSTNADEGKITFLNGATGKRIVCLSNLRNPKNHLALLRAFLESTVYRQGWTLHFIGKDNQDDYSKEIKSFISNNDLKEFVFLYGSCNDIQHILSQCDIGVLASTYEGFPVTLLEYGMAQLAVITSDVGYCSQIITDNVDGFVFSPLNIEDLKMKILNLTDNRLLIEEFGKALASKIVNSYSENAVLELIEKKYLSN